MTENLQRFDSFVHQHTKDKQFVRENFGTAH